MIDQSIDTFRENGKAPRDTQLIATELMEKTHTCPTSILQMKKRKKEERSPNQNVPRQGDRC